MTSPYQADTPALLTRSLTHVVRTRLVFADGGPDLDLEPESGSLSFEEQRTPRAMASLVCPLPDPAQLARIDPRAGVTLVIELGYARPDNLVDVQEVARLVLRSRRVTRPANLLALEASGQESLVIDASPAADLYLNSSTTTLAIQTVVNQCVSTGPFTVTATAGPPIQQVWEPADRWDTIADLADRIGARVFDDGLGRWQIAPAPTLSVPVLSLAVGTNGTITDSDSTLSRDDEWANRALLTYEWDQAVTTTRQVRSNDPTGLVVINPSPSSTERAVPGCDLTLSTRSDGSITITLDARASMSQAGTAKQIVWRLARDEVGGEYISSAIKNATIDSTAGDDPGLRWQGTLVDASPTTGRYVLSARASSTSTAAIYSARRDVLLSSSTTESTPKRIRATRSITSGPMAAVLGNVRTYTETRKVPTTQVQADAAAASLVERLVSRGRGYALRAVSAYWLRPGHTVNVTLPTGDPEDHLVNAVRFDLRDGAMSVVTRLPDLASTIGE